MTVSLLDRKFKYASSDDTRAPGYLRKKFAKMQRKLDKAKAERERQTDVVRPMKKVTR